MKLLKTLVLSFAIVGSAPGADHPNVLFIAVDDLNASPNQFRGETAVSTPNIGRLAERGVLFSNAHCAAPACNPSRASVISGLAPSSTGVYVNSQDWRENNVMKDCVTIPHYFQANGYKTMGGGKIYHASSLSKGAYTGFMDSRPWDEYFPSKDRQMPQEVNPPNMPANTLKEFYGGRFDWAELDIEPDEMADAKVVAWASKQLSQTHDQPLFLGVGIYRPHIPWYTPKKYFDLHPADQIQLPEVRAGDLDDVPKAGKNKLKTAWHRWLVDNNKWAGAVRGYNASVSFTDDMIGRLLDALDNGPLADNTIVVLWSDHGYHLGQKQHWEKFALWEQTTRVPFIISAPCVAKAGSRSNEPVSLLDIYPTLNELCGFQPREKLDGNSLVPLLKNPAKKNGRAVVTTNGYKNHAVRSDNWRYIRYADGSEELYDQAGDPKNFTNLASNPEYDTVKEELSAWLPKSDAETHPTGNGKSKWKDTEKKKNQEARNEN
ncbi:sulfatase [Novipirellula herctigrandis]